MTDFGTFWKNAITFVMIRQQTSGFKVLPKFDLELKQNKNGLTPLKNMLVLILPCFFSYRLGEGKSVAISKLTCFIH